MPSRSPCAVRRPHRGTSRGASACAPRSRSLCWPSPCPRGHGAYCRPRRRASDRFDRHPTHLRNIPVGPARPGTALEEDSQEEEEALFTPGSTVRLATSPSASGPTASSFPLRSILTPSWFWVGAVWLLGALAVVSAPIIGRIALRRWARAAEPIVGDDWTALLSDISERLGLTRRVTLLRSDRAPPCR